MDNRYPERSTEAGRTLFGYPQGFRSPELGITPGEKVCASYGTSWYMSRKAIYFRDKDGAFLRLPWSDIANCDSWYRKIAGVHVYGFRYTTGDGEKHFVPFDDGLPGCFHTMHERCVLELSMRAQQNRFVPHGKRSGPIGHRHEDFLRKRNRADEQEHGNALLHIADIADKAIKSSKLGAQQIAEIVQAASSKYSLLWENTVDIIRSLQRHGFDFSDELLAMSAGKAANVRFAALCCVIESTPEQCADRILAAGLADRSADARWKAADKAQSLLKLGLVPAMEAALAIEKNKRARRSIAFSLSHLRDGYILKQNANGSYNLCVPVAGGVVGADYSAEQVEREGVEAIVAKVKAKGIFGA